MGSAALGGALLLAGLVSAAAVAPIASDRRCDLGRARTGAAGASRAGFVSAPPGGVERDGMKRQSFLANRSANIWCRSS